MSLAATHAARAAAVGSSGSISTTTLAVVGLGTFCLANPEKALHLLQRALLAISDGNGVDGGGDRSLSRHQQHPIVIHAGNSALGGGSGGGGLYTVLFQLSVGAGLCWGSYALLINVLPEQAKNMLPVTQGTFKAAVTSLGKGLLHVKDTLSAEISALLAQQVDLSHKQDETHEQVLYVQDQVADVHDDITHMQNSIDDCTSALQTTDKRTTYIAKGIRLVTQGMTAMLPPDDELVQELKSFQKATTHHHHYHHDVNVNANANKKSDEQRRAMARSSDGSQRSRQSRESTSSSRRRHHQHHHRERGQGGGARPTTATTTTNRNKPANFTAEDTLSVSTGTPVRNVVIPRKKNKMDSPLADSDSITVNEYKELEDVRQLLVSMDKHSRTAL